MRIPLLALLLLTACDKDGKGKNGNDTASTETGDSAPDDYVPPPVCNGGTRWSEGQLAFRDATADWGLDVIYAEATRINAADYDGDGWTDLALRRATGTPDDFSDGGTRNSWLLRNTGLGGFEDVTQSSGVQQTRQSSDENTGRGGQVWAFGDVDNDGDLDLFTGLNDTTMAYDETSEIMINNGDGSFSLGDGGDPCKDSWVSPAGASFVDYDLDGDLDLWMPENQTEDALFANDGSGYFQEVTDEAGLETESWSDIDELNAALCHSWAWSALACDLNNDGWPELLASSYGRMPNLLWRADGDGSYSNQSVASGYAYDERDDWTTNLNAQCHCADNPKDEDCHLCPEPEDYGMCELLWHGFGGFYRWDHTYDREPFRLGGNSGATICADVNNDGWMDLLTGEIVHFDVGESSDPAELLFNTQSPDVVFERPGNDSTGLTREHTEEYWNDGDMTSAVLDFDNDAWPDVYIGSSDYVGCRGLLWHQDSAGQFVSVPVDQGIDHTRSHGVGVADFDRDGDLDVVVGHSGSRCESDCYDDFIVRFFENITGEDTGELANFVQLHLVGATGSNASAIGARVQVTADGVTQTQEVGGGHGHYGAQQDLVLHFGLGAACEAEVGIRWPDASLSTQSFTVGGGYRYLVVQGEEPEFEL